MQQMCNEQKKKQKRIKLFKILSYKTPTVASALSPKTVVQHQQAPATRPSNTNRWKKNLACWMGDNE